MTQKITTICFDGDDTLWSHQPYFDNAQRAYQEVMSVYDPECDWSYIALAKHIEKLPLYGYGVRSFMLAMIDVALEKTNHMVKPTDIQKIMNIGHGLLTHPIELLPDVKETIRALRKMRSFRLLIITKGDLIAQEHKIKTSGLTSLFDAAEIVSEKDAESYARILNRYALSPREIVMVGNSVKSDILPIIRLCGQGVHIPFHTTWAHETVTDDEVGNHPFLTLTNIRDLVDVMNWYQEDTSRQLKNFPNK